MAAKSDYYDILGVLKGASAGEIKKAYRKKALQYHPDKNRDLPEREKEKRKEEMYAVNEAFGVLSDSEKRKKYDEGGPEPTQSTEGRSRGGVVSVRPRWTSYEDLFETFFGDVGIFDARKVWDSIGRKPVSSQSDDFIMIPETDWGLLAALKKAFESKTDGEWRVKKTGRDKRNWMPQEIYSIKRRGEKVLVSRRIDDWRGELYRDSKIKVKRESNPFEIEKEMEPDTFLEEYYLREPGKNRLDNWGDIPSQFGKYLDAMKSLAQKLSTMGEEFNPLQVSDEVEIINRYGKHGARHTREEKEGALPPYFATDDEVVRKVGFGDFRRRMGEAGGVVVRVNGLQTSEEKQARQPEGAGASGESLG
ncbi:hypothetical protein A2865_01955 [Candidatus Woesebacteria bacterium RIFCSPHIGHO2_01_FULL_39_17]|uniref:Chaperone protein DnaJ n=2 Tax=Candidatus Woeseibacteriota TaxID=1752722 RepID=A0A0G0NDD2_9BACT|nr:MAG: Chaperone protein DnaJ [Microgenomates group bacterium GW2011_GWC1_38_12]KKR14134.1 MAG: Chaperone protein DnaJ [Candidatus Woesebacteria bacterium GW2011_GWA1_39_21b]OGM22787.1 MAG: hypothetical protein A2865_01955 [Candidatus Woesebacteria bacterium RIFCSPHIGHO2_01_FULL_39_17]OGM61708.1 MAG: hypothetical protein A3A52_04095 [Candidatus Woesebacteria bacterium RIFCSPLOWO2_01_FULL_39_14]